jgi:hypothetical protein
MPSTARPLLPIASVALACLRLLPVAGAGEQPVGPSGRTPAGDAVIRAVAGDSEIVITTTARVAGAIHSLTWNGREFVDSLDHGRQIQSASNLDVDGELFDEGFNPTEAGCERDMAGPTSTSRVLWFSSGGRDILSLNRMAFWLRPGQSSGGRQALNTTPLSDQILVKHIRLGCPQLPPPARDHAIRFDLAFMLPAEERHERAAFEALTGYMPAAFETFHALADDGGLVPLSDGPGEQPFPVVLSTADGGHAMGVWSGDHCHTRESPPGYGRFRFEAAGVTKWNVVFRERDTRGLRAGRWDYRVWVAVGTREIVERVLLQLREAADTLAE